jgi:spore germination cell wall hydrolase CwlJ-like protein
MDKNYNQQVSDGVTKALSAAIVAAVYGLFFISTPTQKPLLYSQVTQEQLDYEPVPVINTVDWEHDRNLRTPVEIFKIKPPAIVKMRPDPNPGIILHVSSEKISITARERTCLIRNVFYEAGAEPHEGKIAVAQVTWNRLRSGAWGRDLCGVIHAPNQFSWTLDPVKRNRPLNGAQVAAVQIAVDEFLSGMRVSKLKNATHFHATYVNPRWATADTRLKQIGGHVFYALK